MAKGHDGAELAHVAAIALPAAALDEAGARLRRRCRKVVHFVGDLREALALTWEAA